MRSLHTTSCSVALPPEEVLELADEDELLLEDDVPLEPDEDELELLEDDELLELDEDELEPDLPAGFTESGSDESEPVLQATPEEIRAPASSIRVNFTKRFILFAAGNPCLITTPVIHGSHYPD
jgi:hypothetical protein